MANKIVAIALFGLLLVLPFVASKTAIVIGAGFSGLSTAIKLQQAGFKVAIFEARNRVGGRVWTDRSWGTNLEIGGAWIHGPNGNPMTPLADSFNLARVVTDDDSLIRVRSNKVRYTDAEVNAWDTKFADFLDRMNTARNNLQVDTSLGGLMAQKESALWQDASLQWHLGSNLEFDTGASTELLSAWYWDSDKMYSGADVIFTGGYDGLLNNLIRANSLDIRLNTVVSAIKYDTTGVTVTTNTGVFQSDVAVSTIPLGVMKKGAVKWDPALPAKKVASFSKVLLGATNKVFLEFETSFWDRSNVYFGVDTGMEQNTRGKFSYWLNMYPYLKRNILTGFATGAFGLIMETWTDAQILNECYRLLNIMFNKPIPTPTRVWITRWNSDPYAYGTYPFAGIGSLKSDWKNIAEAVGGRVFFAGDWCSYDYRGTVHGSWLSGITAATAAAAIAIPNPLPESGIAPPDPNAPTAPPLPPSAAMSYLPALQSTLRLNLDISVYSNNQTNFITTFRNDIASALGIDATQIEVLDVSAGSLTVKFRITTGSTDRRFVLSQLLNNAYTNKTSDLYRGTFTRYTDTTATTLAVQSVDLSACLDGSYQPVCPTNSVTPPADDGGASVHSNGDSSSSSLSSSIPIIVGVVVGVVVFALLVVIVVVRRRRKFNATTAHMAGN